MIARATLWVAVMSIAIANPAASEGSAASPGKQLYEQYCALCHGPEGKGDGPAAKAVVPMPRDFSVGQFKFDADSDGRTGTERDLFLVIRDGAGPVGGNPLMAPWGQLGDERIAALVDYVRSLDRRNAR